MGYKLALWNCGRGLLPRSSKFKEIEQYVAKYKPHTFGVIEADIHGLGSHQNRTKKYSTQEVKEALKLEGYDTELPTSWETHGQARLVVYVSKEVKYKRQILVSDKNELPCISLQIGFGKATKFNVHYFYREWTNGVTGENSNEAQKHFLYGHVEQWKELLDQHRDFVALGDNNLCAMSWNEQNYKHKDLANIVQEFLLAESCEQLVNKYTRVQTNGDHVQRSCIDHVITNVISKCTPPEVMSGGSSDHMAVLVTKKSREIRSQPRFIKKRNYKNFNIVDFLHDLRNYVTEGRFNIVLESENIDEAAAIFSGTFGTLLNKHAPLRNYQVRNNYSPWLSKETKAMIEARDILKKEAIEESDAEKMRNYKKLRNSIKNTLQSEELNYYQNKFYQENPSIASLWSSANDYLNTSKRSHSNTPSVIISKNRAYTTPRDIANILNDTFIEKVKQICNQTVNLPSINPTTRLQNWLSSRTNTISTFKLNPISKVQLRKILKKLKGNRSSGVDFIDGFSIKLAAPLFEDVLLHLVNLSITKSRYPQQWKSSKINPHFKSGDKFDGTNYRPVSDLIFVSKIAEAAVFEQVFEHFVTNDLWHPNHHGYKPGHSTATAITQMYDLWIRAAEEKKLSAALLLDLSAAFDVVDHQILLSKLELYNFDSDTVAWFKSYLSNRFQYVMVESSLSDPKQVGDQSVPQGSLLGPLLFIIYYNDFPAAREEGTSVLYADDDTDIVASDDIEQLTEKIQNEANLSTDWVRDNRLVCSGKKTKLLIIGTKEMKKSKQKDKLVEITVAGHLVKESESERLLGLIVNNTMTWEHHLYGNEDYKGLIPKLSQRAKLIQRLAAVMPPEKLKVLAEGIFFSVLNYCVQVYGNVWDLTMYNEKQDRSTAFTKDDNRKLQIIVNKVLRALTGLDYDTPVSQLVAVSGQLSVQQRTAFHTLTSMYKTVQYGLLVYCYNRLDESRPRPYLETRSSVMYRVDYKLSISRCSYFYRGSRLFNLLPRDVLEATNIKTFKKKAKAWVKKNIPVVPP